MAAFLAGTAAYAVLFTLAGAVLGHLRRPSALACAVRVHGVLRRPRAVATVAITSEAALAASLLLGVLLAARGPLAAGLGGAAALFGLYGCYASHLVATGRAGPCGCGGSTVNLSFWVAGRAFALAGLAGVALAGSGEVAELSVRSTGPSSLLVALAGATFGTLLWALPAAMHDSSRRPVEVWP